MKYQFQRSDVEDLAINQNWKIKVQGNEMSVEYCPYCSGGSNDKWTFSINLEKGVFNCFRGSCNKSGHFVQLARDLGFKINSIDDTSFVKPKQQDLKIPPAAEKIYGKRGISKQTIEKYKLQLSDKFPNTMVFPFIDDKGIQVSFKLRKADYNPKTDKMKEWFYPKNSKPILFGMHCATDYNLPLIITEGQLDALSLDTAGIKNAVSVPTGANGFSWVKHCREWVNKFPEIIIFGDNDAAGRSMITGIQKYFKRKVIKVVPPESYLGEKDANDILRTFGADELQRALDSAKEREMKEIKQLSDIEDININELDGIKTGITKLDNCLIKMFCGGVYILTGRRGEGKSTFASQIFANVIDQNETCLAYSGELNTFHFKNWLVSQIKGRKHKDCSDEVVNKFLKDKAYIYDDSELWEVENVPKICESIETAIVTKGIRFILLDNLMTIMSDYDDEPDFYKAQQRLLKRLKTIAKSYSVVIMLIAHPKKDSEKELDNDSISGTGVIADIADAVLTYSRNNDNKTFNEFQSLVGVVKNRMNGDYLTKDNRLKMIFDKQTKRVIEVSDNRAYEYSCFKQGEDDFEEVPF